MKNRNTHSLSLGIFILMLRIQQVASLGIFVSIYPVHLPDEDKNLLTFANEEEIEMKIKSLEEENLKQFSEKKKAYKFDKYETLKEREILNKDENGLLDPIEKFPQYKQVQITEKNEENQKDSN